MLYINIIINLQMFQVVSLSSTGINSLNGKDNCDELFDILEYEYQCMSFEIIH